VSALHRLFDDALAHLTTLGLAADDIAWCENIKPPADPDEFGSEVIFVICNSGMQNKVARGIYNRVMDALASGHSASSVFKHKGKTAAIDLVWRDRSTLLEAYLCAADKLEFCQSLPWVGQITKYHLAKNFGADVAKPDVHLQRLADFHGTTAQELCAELATSTGYRIATIDTLLWRACANGVIDSRTGKIKVVAQIDEVLK
jgi:hypothetical protein